MGTAASTQDELEARVRRVYAAANDFADEVGGIEHGLNILYGPPILRPVVMVVSMQGGGADGIRQREWPSRLHYLDPQYPFGKRLKSDFEYARLRHVLETQTVATNVVFPQWPRFAEWERQPTAEAWRRRSRKWLDELVTAMAPTVILTYGQPPFVALTGSRKRKGYVAVASFSNVPVVGCGHLMQGAARPERREALVRVKQMTEV